MRIMDRSSPVAAQGRMLGRWRALLLLLLPGLSCIACTGPSELPREVVLRVRGHQEVVISPSGRLTPRWFGPQQPIGVCLDAPVALDTSQWRVQLRLTGEAPGRDFVSPSHQASTTLCFERFPPPDWPSSLDLEVCATLEDRFDQRFYRLPCFRAAYESDSSAFTQQLRVAQEQLRTVAELTLEDRLAALDDLADEVLTQGYPLLATNLALVSVHELLAVGTPEALVGARRRLEGLPGWLEQPEAAVPAAKAMLQRAKLELAAGRSRRAWQWLGEAADLARGVAAVDRPGIVIQQARILARLGAGREPIERLEAMLEDCQRGGCREGLVATARELVGWLVLIDPDAADDDLDLAGKTVLAAETAARAEQVDVGGERERANRLINRAFLAYRRGEDPRPSLAEARAILAPLEPSARRASLLAWSTAIEGLAALAGGAPDSALEPCGAAARSQTQAAAWGWSCLAQAQRQLGDLEAAAAAFDQAILRHALPMGDNLDRTLAPGQGADDSYRAARVAIDRGDLEGAWQLLEALDRLAAERFGACDDETQVSQQDRAAQRRALLAQLAWTEPPLAVARSQQVRPIRRALLQALDDLHREQLAVCRRSARWGPAPADVRAFALPDEVLVLRRVPAGFLVAWRTSLARAELRRWLDQIATAQAGGELDDAAWRSLVRPVATALLAPDAEPFAAVTRFALHGVLQRVPLPALPIAAADGERWLAELTTVVRSPALVETPLAAPDRAAAEPLFVVDPQRNLPSGATARATYRERFGTARILFGEQASLQAVREALPSAAFLHIDAHGSYDEAFPELSRLQMSDGFLTASDLATQAGQYRFVNLSGCHTGRVTPTGDSGHQGLAGVLARRGAPWVIAHRSATFDRLGGDFNRAFYREIDRGRRVLEAFRNAHGELRQHYPAAAWSNLMLWGAGSEAKPERRGLPEG